MRKNTIFLTIAVAVMLACGTGLSHAQDNSSKAEVEAKPVKLPPSAYHLDFSLNELEDGKKINTRQYSMNLLAVPSAGPRLPIGYEKDVKIGTRVPVETDEAKMAYMDVGTSIYCQVLSEDPGTITLDARAEVSSLVSRFEKDSYTPSGRNPMLRQLKIEASSVVTLSKLTSLGVVDDQDSKRQFQLEVTVTNMR